MIQAAPEFQECVNAVLMKMDWRPLAQLGPEDAGTFVERVLASVVLDEAVVRHNKSTK